MPVPAQRTRVVHDPGEGAQQRRLARTDRTDHQDQLSTFDSQVDIMDADRTVLMYGTEPDEVDAPQRIAWRDRRRGRRAR